MSHGRGLPAALLTLRAAGEVESAAEDPDDLPALIEIGPETESVSSVLERLRWAER